MARQQELRQVLCLTLTYQELLAPPFVHSLPVERRRFPLYVVRYVGIRPLRRIQPPMYTTPPVVQRTEPSVLCDIAIMQSSVVAWVTNACVVIYKPWRAIISNRLSIVDGISAPGVSIRSPGFGQLLKARETHACHRPFIIAGLIIISQRRVYY